MICKVHKPKGNKGELMFANAEEEIFANQAQYSFEFDVVTDSDSSLSGKWSEGDVEMIPHRRVLLIEGKQLPNIIQIVKTTVV